MPKTFETTFTFDEADTNVLLKLCVGAIANDRHDDEVLRFSCECRDAIYEMARTNGVSVSALNVSTAMEGE